MRHIDADKLLQDVKREDFNDCLDYDIFRFLVEEAPTADVVPKSEVENLKVLLEMKDVAYEGLKELYFTDTTALIEAREKTEVEVAKEIFEEIEKITNSSIEKEHFKGAWFNIAKFEERLAKLKKKYTEGEPNGSKN